MHTLLLNPSRVCNNVTSEAMKQNSTLFSIQNRSLLFFNCVETGFIESMMMKIILYPWKILQLRIHNFQLAIKRCVKIVDDAEYFIFRHTPIHSGRFCGGIFFSLDVFVCCTINLEFDLDLFASFYFAHICTLGELFFLFFKHIFINYFLDSLVCLEKKHFKIFDAPYNMEIMIVFL